MKCSFFEVLRGNSLKIAILNNKILQGLCNIYSEKLCLEQKLKRIAVSGQGYERRGSVLEDKPFVPTPCRESLMF